MKYHKSDSIRVTGEDHPFPEHTFVFGRTYDAEETYRGNSGLVVLLEEEFPASVTPHLYDDVELIRDNDES